MPTKEQAATEMYYSLIKRQENYPLEELYLWDDVTHHGETAEEHIVTYTEEELTTLSDVEAYREQELSCEKEK